MQLPWCNHDHILARLKFEETKEDIISTSNDDGCIGLHLWKKLIVEYTRLHLVGDENEQHFI